MKNSFILISLLLGSIFFSGCSNEKIKIKQANQEEMDNIIPLGKQLSAKLLGSLKKELQSAMETGGPAYAIGFCKIKAKPLTDSVATSSKFNVDIKRTSFKYRNPKNTPDEAEVLALEYYTQLYEKGKELPEDFLQKISENGKNVYNYYKPLLVSNECLICHGTQESLSLEVVSLIHEKYPEDKAMGYEAGDFRGLLRIKFTEMDKAD